MTAGALEGVRVIELTHAWAGPYCGMMLGDMGAEIIKIENPRQKTEARGGSPYIGNESVALYHAPPQQEERHALVADVRVAAARLRFLAPVFENLDDFSRPSRRASFRSTDPPTRASIR